MTDSQSYSMLKELGAGAFGCVFSALRGDSKQKVAIKRVEKVGNQLSREFEVLKELIGSPHCVQLLECFYTRKEKSRLIQNMVFEFVENDLEKVIKAQLQKNRPLPEHLVKLYAYQIFKGLEDIHSKCIIHRDLKPENILATDSDVVKLADFGSAKFIEPGSKNTPYIVSRYYRAPELLLCLTTYNGKVDVWAAGCIMAELAMLDPLFKGRTEGDQLFAIMRMLGSLSASDKDFYGKQVLFLQKHIEAIPRVARNEAKLSELYSRFSDPNDARLFFESVFQYNPKLRLSAAEAVAHKFFNDIKPHYAQMMARQRSAFN